MANSKNGKSNIISFIFDSDHASTDPNCFTSLFTKNCTLLLADYSKSSISELLAAKIFKIDMKRFTYFLGMIYCFICLGCMKREFIITRKYIEFKTPPKSLRSFQIVRVSAEDNNRPPNRFKELKKEKFGISTNGALRDVYRIYFDRRQEGLTWVRFNGLEKLDSIGPLRKKNWYIIRNLHPLGYNIFVYINRHGASTVYVDQKVNW